MTSENISTIAFNVWSTGKPLDLEVLVDSELVFEQTISKKTPVSININDDEEKTVSLKLIMKNKAADHTVIDSHGTILEDSVLEFSDIKIDEIDIEEIVWFQAKYSHDFNGTSDLTVENFYGSMGCNGTVEIDIITPMYMWLLENI